MGEVLSPLEIDLLNHIATGCPTHTDGSPIAWGAWMSVCLESLHGRRYVEQRNTGAGYEYIITDAGRAALKGGLADG